MIGRLVYATPSEGERYYLRLLLINVRGPKSFEDLLTVNDHKCATFKESALKWGLLEHDQSITLCMEEGVQVEMPSVLRKLFATLLIFYNPSDPRALWEKYYPALSDDHRCSYPADAATVLQKTAQQVEAILEGMCKSFKQFDMADLHGLQASMLRSTRVICDALSATVPVQYVEARKQLNSKQREAYDCILRYVEDGKQGAFFIDGPGGTGKTFLYCALYEKIRELGKIVLATATSGIAASNLPNGRTAHSRFKIPLENNSSLTCDAPKQSSLAALLRETILIIWDEASMSKKENIKALDLML